MMKTTQNLRLNPTQLDQYRKLCCGLAAYSIEDKKHLDEEDRRTILYQQNKFWSVVNSLRQLKMAAFLNNVFKTMFPTAPMTETLDILLRPVVDSHFVLDRTLKELDVPQGMLIRECMRIGLLPKNFLA